MARLTERDIIAAYREAFNRSPNTGERNYWVNKEDSQLREALVKDPHSQGLYASLRATQQKQQLPSSGGTVTVTPGALPAIPSPQNPTSNTPIPANLLGQGYDINQIINSTVGPNTGYSDIGGLLALYNQDSKYQAEYDTKAKEITDLMSRLGGQSSDFQTELERQGVISAYNQVRELNLRGAQLQGEIQKFDAETEQLRANIDNQAIPTGLILGQQGQLQKQRDLTRLTKTAELASTVALAQAYQGNAELGTRLAQQAVDAKYQPILVQLETAKTQLGFISDKLTKDEARQAKTIDTLLGIKMKQIEDQKDQERMIQGIAIEAASNGAPLSLVNSIRTSSNPETAAQIAGEWSQKFQRDKQIESMAIEAGNSGAPATVLEAMRKSGDPAEASRIYGSWAQRAGKVQDVEKIAIQAAGDGAPANIVAQIRKAKDAVSAAQIYGTWNASRPKGTGGRASKEYQTFDDFLAANKSKYPLATANTSAGIAQRRAAESEYNSRLSAGQFLGPSQRGDFSNSQIESSVREDAVALLDQVDNGEITVDKAYDKLRTLYSPVEVSDNALRSLLGMSAPNQQNAGNTPNQTLVNSISKYLFGSTF